MPTYEYKCRVCEDIVVVQHSINDSPTVVCGKCQAKRVKVFSAPSIEFKGTGWGHQ
jgi:putative FmdB family regulatory protein